MDKAAYCDEMERRLRGVGGFLDGQSVPRATVHANQHQADRQPIARKLRTLIAEALTKVDALRAATDSDWETAREDLDRRWNEIAELRADFTRPLP
jgi:hypothetical protein